MTEAACVYMAVVFFFISSAFNLYVLNEHWRKEKKHYEPLDFWPNVVNALIVGAATAVSTYIFSHVGNPISGAITGFMLGASLTAGFTWNFYRGVR